MAQKEFPELYPGWKTVRKIGSGSFGTVYEIERDLFGKIEKAALKYIYIPHSEGEIEELYGNGYDDASITAHFKEYLADIVREYSLMAEMKGHTNVVYCDDIRYIQHDEGFGWDIFIKMELLTPMLKMPVQAFSEEQVIRLGMDICRALVLCRDKGIVHRDIKPQNIFVSDTGDYKLGDFGIARTMERSTGATKTGTIPYMAPEVYNNQSYGSRADIYSLGLVLYWLMNERRLPFLPLPPRTPTVHDTDDARIRRLSGEAVPAPKNGSEELKAIVLRACAFNPEDRFQTAAEMLNALENIGLEKPTPQPKPVPEEHTVRKDPVVKPEPKPKTVRKPEADPDDETVREQTAPVPVDKTAPAPAWKPKPMPEPTPVRFSVVQDSSEVKLQQTSRKYNPKPNGEAKEKKKDDPLGWVVLAIFLYLVFFVPDSIPAVLLLIPMYLLFVLYRAWFRKRHPNINIYREKMFWIPLAVVCAAVVVLLLLFGGKKKMVAISAGADHTVVLYENGRAEAIGNNESEQCYVSGWEDIVDISAGERHTVGLKSDGTVVARGFTGNGECSVEDWTEIVAVAAGDDHTVGLKSDGTVVATGRNVYGECDLSEWTDITQISAGNCWTVGLKSDGTVVAVGNDSDGRCDVSGWTDIVQIATGFDLTVGLKSDGTVVAAGNVSINEAGISEWTDIVQISVGFDNVAGLKSDGTVVTNDFYQDFVSEWTDILAVAAGDNYYIGLKSDGTLVAVGYNDHGQCDVEELQ